jgi:hypothetical protein
MTTKQAYFQRFKLTPAYKKRLAQNRRWNNNEGWAWKREYMKKYNREYNRLP